MVTGSGAYFSSAADLESGLQRGSHRAPSERSYAVYEPFLSLLDIAAPVIGALNGDAIADHAPLAVRATKRAIQRGLDLHVRDAARLEADAQAESLASDDARERIAAALAGRPPRATG